MPIIALYKPVGPTSHDMITQLRRITQIKRIGHAGTLDPLAQGLLVVGIGRNSTRLLPYVMQGKKEYTTIIHLGETSSTGDGEGSKVPTHSPRIPTRNEIEVLLPRFKGLIQQRPPLYSAIKIKGKPAYRYARQGKHLNLGKRTVTIDEIQLLSYTWPELALTVTCGSGVYIRSLAADIGTALGVGGYMAALTRTRVGNYTLDKAMTISQCKEWWAKDGVVAADC